MTCECSYSNKMTWTRSSCIMSKLKSILHYYATYKRYSLLDAVARILAYFWFTHGTPGFSYRPFSFVTASWPSEVRSSEVSFCPAPALRFTHAATTKFVMFISWWSTWFLSLFLSHVNNSIPSYLSEARTWGGKNARVYGASGTMNEKATVSLIIISAFANLCTILSIFVHLGAFVRLEGSHSRKNSIFNANVRACLACLHAKFMRRYVRVRNTHFVIAIALEHVRAHTQIIQACSSSMHTCTRTILASSKSSRKEIVQARILFLVFSIQHLCVCACSFFMRTACIRYFSGARAYARLCKLVVTAATNAHTMHTYACIRVHTAALCVPKVTCTCHACAFICARMHITHVHISYTCAYIHVCAAARFCT
jgi:hypothetical protein